MNISLSAFLINFIGFLINMLPFMTLFFIPYNAESFRIHISGKSLHIISSAFVIVTAILFSCFNVLGLNPENIEDPLENAILWGSIAMTLIFIRGSFVKKFIVWTCSYFYHNLKLMILWVCLTMRSLINDEFYSADDILASLNNLIYDRYNIICLLIITIILFPFFAAFERRILKPYLDIVKKEVMWLESILLIILMLFFFTLTSFYVTLNVSLYTDDDKLLYILGIPGSAIIFTCLLLACFLIFRTSLTKARNNETGRQLELMKESSRSLQREIEHTRELYHDIRQLLRQLHTICDNYDIHELDGYIERIVTLTDHTDALFCENLCLNSLFQYYTGLANERHVPIRITAKCPDISIRDADLTILVANILENAITSAEEYRDKMNKEPFISVTVGIIKDHLAMQFSNSCADVLYSSNVPEKLKGSFLPADAYKSTHEDRGYGLKRIHIIADRYNGLSQFSYNNERYEWTARISIPVKKKENHHENRYM